MLKFLTAVLVSLSFTSAWALDLNQVDPNYSVKNIIRSKLWYEGVEFKRQDIQDKQFQVDSFSQLPEEVTVALDKLDS